MIMYKFGIRLTSSAEENKRIISFLENLGYNNKLGFTGNVGCGASIEGLVYAVDNEGNEDKRIYCDYAAHCIIVYNTLVEAREHILASAKLMIINTCGEIRITSPEGYEIDMENSTFECIKFKKKELTYKDIARELFFGNNSWYINNYGYVTPCKAFETYSGSPNNCTSEEQAEKLLAINKLMNVAKYLNNGWKPDWNNNHEHKYYLLVYNNNTTIDYSNCTSSSTGAVYFKTKELAIQAVKILGEDTIKLALSTDY